jgi:hypothetical protein
MWPEIYDAIKSRSGQEWHLLAAGAMRDPNTTLSVSNFAEWKALRIVHWNGSNLLPHVEQPMESIREKGAIWRTDKVVLTIRRIMTAGKQMFWS